MVEGNYRHTVDLHKQTYTCRYWELKGIPCTHAICVMYNRKINPDLFISHWYKKETYRKCYSTVLQPVRGMTLWPKADYPVIQPPHITKKLGRPKKHRRKDRDEPKKQPKYGKYSRRGVQMTCSICHAQGHNKQSCPVRGEKNAQVIHVIVFNTFSVVICYTVLN